MISNWERRVSRDVSTKRAGTEPPAFAQTMSGGLPSFQAVASERIRAFSAAEVTSALMLWKRWEGDFAAAWHDVRRRESIMWHV